MEKPFANFTQVGEFLLMDKAIVAAIPVDCKLFEYLSKAALAKAAGSVENTFVIDTVAAATVVGEEGVKYILNRENWRPRK